VSKDLARDVDKLEQEPVDAVLLERARRRVAARESASRELRLRAAVGTDGAENFDLDEHLAAVRRMLAGVGYR
jgi:hypothetical protein